MNNGPYIYYSPAIREPLPLRRKPYTLPLPPEAGDKPQKIDWMRTLLPPFIMLIALGVISSVIQTRGLFGYAMVMMGIYPAVRVGVFQLEKYLYEKNEKKRAEIYAKMLYKADREIVSFLSKQRELLNNEFLSTAQVRLLMEGKGENRKLWYRTNAALDFMCLRLGVYEGASSFPIIIPKDDNLDNKDPLLSEARKIKDGHTTVENAPYLLPLKEIGSVVILGNDEARYRLAHRLLLDILAHHRPDQAEIFVLSNHRAADRMWGWLKWAPHCKAFELEKILAKQDAKAEKIFDFEKDLDHLVFGNQPIKVFLGHLENSLDKISYEIHRVFVVDVDGIQRFDDEFINSLIMNANAWNISLIFVGGDRVPRSVRGVLKPVPDFRTCTYVDTRINVKDKEEKEYHTLIKLDDLPDEIKNRECESVSRALSSVRLLSSSGDALLPSSTSLFDVLELSKETNQAYDKVLKNWETKFREEDLLQFPIGLAEDLSRISSYSINLLEESFGGKNAYHTMLIGTTGSGKSEFIKSLILGAAYKYPPQYLNFFCMDFKGGSTMDQLKELPHVVGVMTNLKEVDAQRGLIAIRHEIDRRQKEFENKGKDIWEYNKGRSLADRMPHLILVIDEFTRGLDLLNSTTFNLQDLLEKRLIIQGRSLGIYLILANQVVNGKVTKLLPNTGWRIALRVASKDQLQQFIASGLKPPKYSGRGYIQAIGEDVIEFQSGYSGTHVQYSNLVVKSNDAPIKEILPSGRIRNFIEPKTENLESEEEEDKKRRDKFLQINQMVRAIGQVQKHMEIQPAKKIYLPPLKRAITLDECETGLYRKFSTTGWAKKKIDKNLLQVPLGFADIVEKCEQIPVVLDLLKTSPNLLIAGSQTDILDALRTILLSLSLGHSPNEVQVLMMEFGNGLREIPAYPHIADTINGKDTEKITRCVNYLESVFSDRSSREDFSQINDGNFPHLFLVINNVAGLTNNINLYERVLKLIRMESFRYGIHLFFLALPKGTGTRIQSTDLNAINSKIVFPSINHDDYWSYLTLPENKLVKLTGMEELPDEITSKAPSRAYWMCADHPQFNAPVEIQIAQTQYKENTGDAICSEMNASPDYVRLAPIKILEKFYPLKNSRDFNSSTDNIPVGIKWSDLSEFSVSLASLPAKWGVSGSRSSGKTNFLLSFVQRLKNLELDKNITVFSIFKTNLTTYCSENKIKTILSSENFTETLQEILSKIQSDKKHKQIIIFDDLNLYWERDIDKPIVEFLDKFSTDTYDEQNLLLVSAFDYSLPIIPAMTRHALFKQIHDNKTGFSIGYEDNWLVSSQDLLAYKKKFKGIPPPGRGIFSLKGNEIEMQSFLSEG